MATPNPVGPTNLNPPKVTPSCHCQDIAITRTIIGQTFTKQYAFFHNK